MLIIRTDQAFPLSEVMQEQLCGQLRIHLRRCFTDKVTSMSDDTLTDRLRRIIRLGLLNDFKTPYELAVLTELEVGFNIALDSLLTLPTLSTPGISVKDRLADLMAITGNTE